MRDKYGRFVKGFKHTEATKQKFRLRKEEKHGNWKGGRRVDSQGYVQIKRWAYGRTKTGYVRENRLVWEEYHRASLLPWGVVHHINENRQDNRIENLQGMTRGQHKAYHIEIKRQFKKVQ